MMISLAWVTWYIRGSSSPGAVPLGARSGPHGRVVFAAPNVRVRPSHARYATQNYKTPGAALTHHDYSYSRFAQYSFAAHTFELVKSRKSDLAATHPRFWAA